MTSQLRKLVSKKKKRFAREGFDLDLSYITERVIAMGFPADSVGGIYRNPRKEVIRMLDTYHQDHYKVYNLCSERSYNHAIFYNRVSEYPIDDHNVPTMAMIRQFCEDAEAWLQADDANVIAVHCKAGKGRTGLMICCWLLHTKMCLTPRDALERFGIERTKDRKGVTIPSQRRYLRYYDILLRHNVDPRELPPPGQIPVVFLADVMTSTVPTYEKSGANMRILITDRSGSELYSDMAKIKSENKNPSGGLYFDCRNCPLKGDIRLLIFYKNTKILQLWFNTLFITRTSLSFRKHELDKANKDKTHIPNDFKLNLTLSLPIKNPYFDDVYESEDDTMPSRTEADTDDDDRDGESDAVSEDGQSSENGSGILGQESGEGERKGKEKDGEDKKRGGKSSPSSGTRQPNNGISPRKRDLPRRRTEMPTSSVQKTSDSSHAHLRNRSSSSAEETISKKEIRQSVDSLDFNASAISDDSTSGAGGSLIITSQDKKSRKRANKKSKDAEEGGAKDKPRKSKTKSGANQGSGITTSEEDKTTANSDSGNSAPIHTEQSNGSVISVQECDPIDSSHAFNSQETSADTATVASEAVDREYGSTADAGDSPTHRDNRASGPISPKDGLANDSLERSESIPALSHEDRAVDGPLEVTFDGSQLPSESEPRRRGSIQANLRRLSVRITNVPNLFGRHAAREDSANAGSTSGVTVPSPTKQEEVPNPAVAAEPEELVDEPIEQQGKAKSKKSRIARLSVNFDSLKKITSLVHSTESSEKKPKPHFSKHTRFDERRLSTSAPSLANALSASSSSLPSGIDGEQTLSVSSSHSNQGSSEDDTASQRTRTQSECSSADTGGISYSNTPLSDRSYINPILTPNDTSDAPYEILSHFASTAHATTSSSAPPSSSPIMDAATSSSRAAQQRSKVSEIIDKWNSQNWRNENLSSNDIKRKSDSISRRQQLPMDQRARLSFSANVSDDCHSNPVMLSQSLPESSSMSSMGSPSNFIYSSPMTEAVAYHNSRFMPDEVEQFEGKKRSASVAYRVRPKSMQIGMENDRNDDSEGATLAGNNHSDTASTEYTAVPARRCASGDSTSWVGQRKGRSATAPRPVGKVYLAAKALEEADSAKTPLSPIMAASLSSPRSPPLLRRGPNSPAPSRAPKKNDKRATMQLPSITSSLSSSLSSILSPRLPPPTSPKSASLPDLAEVSPKKRSSTISYSEPNQTTSTSTKDPLANRTSAGVSWLADAEAGPPVRGRQRAASVASAGPLRKVSSSATLSSNSVLVHPNHAHQGQAKPKFNSTPLSEFRESKEVKKSDKDKLWSRFKGSTHSSPLADVANETGPEGVSVPLLGRRKSGGSGSSTAMNSSSNSLSGSGNWPETSTTQALKAFKKAALSRSVEPRDDVDIMRKLTDPVLPIGASLPDDRQRSRKWSFMNGSGGGSMIVGASKDRDTRKSKRSSIHSDTSTGTAALGSMEEGTRGRLLNWKGKSSDSTTTSSSSQSPRGARSILTTLKREDAELKSSGSHFLPVPHASPASRSASPTPSSSACSSLSSSPSSAFLSGQSPSTGASLRRKSRAEDDDLTADDLRRMLREKEKEVEEARKALETKQYEVRELKERLWEKLNLVDD